MLVPDILRDREKIKESEQHWFWVPSWKVYDSNMILTYIQRIVHEKDNPNSADFDHKFH